MMEDVLGHATRRQPIARLEGLGKVLGDCGRLGRLFGNCDLVRTLARYRAGENTRPIRLQPPSLLSIKTLADSSTCPVSGAYTSASVGDLVVGISARLIFQRPTVCIHEVRGRPDQFNIHPVALV